MPNTTSWRWHLDGASSCRDPREPHGKFLACAAYWRSAEEMLPRLRSGTSSASERWQVVEARGALMSKGIDSLAAGLTAGDTLLEAAHQAVRSGAFGVQSAGTQPSYPTISDDLPETAPNGVSTTTGVTA